MELKRVLFDTRQSCDSNGWLDSEALHKLDVRDERSRQTIILKYVNSTRVL